MTSFICADSDLENNRSEIDRLTRKWQDYRGNIFKIHGDGPVSERLFKEWGEAILEKPVDPNFILVNSIQIFFCILLPFN